MIKPKQAAKKYYKAVKENGGKSNKINKKRIKRVVEDFVKEMNKTNQETDIF